MAKAVAASQADAASGSSQNREVNDNLWLFIQEDGTYVIKLFSIRSLEKAMSVANEPRFDDRGRLYTTQVAGESWSFLLLGPYRDRPAAEADLEQLPEHHRRAAQITPVSSIASKRCAKRAVLRKEEARGLEAYCLD